VHKFNFESERWNKK